jgi:hypothetical protein
MKKTLVLSLISLFSVALCAQSSLYYNPNEQADKDCDNSLITTFSRYFTKKEEPKKELTPIVVPTTNPKKEEPKQEQKK